MTGRLERIWHHEHLIDAETGKVLEFRDSAIEALLRSAASCLGYRLLQYRLEVFGEMQTSPRKDLCGAGLPAQGGRSTSVAVK
jgi:Fe2+ or Zn2+ uptake regulation protein